MKAFGKGLFSLWQFIYKFLVTVPVLHFWGWIVLNGFAFWQKFIAKLEWTSYGIWFWHLCGLVAGLIWTLIYEYGNFRKGKDKRSTTLIDRS